MKSTASRSHDNRRPSARVLARRIGRVPRHPVCRATGRRAPVRGAGRAPVVGRRTRRDGVRRNTTASAHERSDDHPRAFDPGRLDAQPQRLHTPAGRPSGSAARARLYPRRRLHGGLGGEPMARRGRVQSRRHRDGVGVLPARLRWLRLDRGRPTEPGSSRLAAGARDGSATTSPSSVATRTG